MNSNTPSYPTYHGKLDDFPASQPSTSHGLTDHGATSHPVTYAARPSIPVGEATELPVELPVLDSAIAHNYILVKPDYALKADKILRQRLKLPEGVSLQARTVTTNQHFIEHGIPAGEHWVAFSVSNPLKLELTSTDTFALLHTGNPLLNLPKDAVRHITTPTIYLERAIENTPQPKPFVWKSNRNPARPAARSLAELNQEYVIAPDEIAQHTPKPVQNITAIHPRSNFDIDAPLRTDTALDAEAAEALERSARPSLAKRAMLIVKGLGNKKSSVGITNFEEPKDFAPTQGLEVAASPANQVTHVDIEIEPPFLPILETAAQTTKATHTATPSMRISTPSATTERLSNALGRATEEAKPNGLSGAVVTGAVLAGAALTAMIGNQTKRAAQLQQRYGSPQDMNLAR